MRLYLTVSLLFLLAFASAEAIAVGVPAGTIIQPSVQALYCDLSGNMCTAGPAYASLVVAQTAGVSAQSALSEVECAPGQDVFVQIRIANLGNGSDSFTLAVSSSRSWNCAMIRDDNGDGVRQSSETQTINSTGAVPADAYVSCFAKVSVPADAVSGDTVTVTAVSNFSASVSAQAQFALTVSAELPTVFITSPTSSPTWNTADAAINLGGTAGGSLAITGVRWSSDRGASGTCSGTTNWFASGISLAAGSNVITVTATDAGGRTATDTLTVTYTPPDTTAPGVTITGPTSSSTYTTTSSSLSISGTASDNVGVASVAWSNDRGGSGACSGTTSWSASGISLQAGQNVITVTASDAAGNRGTDTLTVTYNAPDTTAPGVTITGPTSSSTYTTTSSSLSISGTASDNVGVASVAWSNDRGGSGACSGTTSWSASGISLQTGQNVITVTASDAAGNRGTDVLTVTYQIPDATAPTVTISAPTSLASYTTASSSVDLAGTAADNVGVTLVTWSNDRGGAGTCSGTATWSASRVALSIGQNVIVVTAQDAAGNRGTDVLTITCNAPDTAAPTISITAPTAASTYSTTSSSITLSGTASDNVGVVSVVWSSDRGISGACTGTTAWTTPAITLLEGTNVITVGASDAAGNNSTDVLTVTYTATESSLNIKIKNPSSKGKSGRNTRTVTISGTATDDSLVTSVTWYNATTGDSGPCSLDGDTFTASGIELAPGDNVITAAAADDSGNIATDALTVTQIDAAPGDGWRGLCMVSLPIIPDDVDPQTSVGFSRNYWCNFHPAKNAYALYPDLLTWLDPADATPGRGFWGYFDYPVEGPRGTIPPQDQPVSIRLSKGWNLIGNPFISPVKWSISAIMVKGPDGSIKPLGSSQGLVQSHAWGWRNDPSNPGKGDYYLVYDASVLPGVDDQMLPWRAYWIKANRGCELIIPAP